MGLVFLGTPAFAVPSLRRLAGEGYHILVVYTQPDRPAGRGRRPRPPAVKLAAQELGLPVRQPPSLRDRQALEELAALEPEVMVAVAYGEILRPEVLKIPPRGVLNVHPSLLPRYRGASPIAAAILAGEQETGVTVILMDEGMDTGPILVQRAEPIDPEDTADSLARRLADLGAQLLVEALPGWLRGELEPTPQDHARATKTALLRKEDGAIHWELSAEQIWRQVRAYNPWPGAYTGFDGELLHIWRAWPLAGDSAQPPGTVVPLTRDQVRQLPPGSDPEAFAVQTGSGLLAVLLIQRSGRRPLPPGEFLRGLRGFLGRRLASPR